MSERRLRPSVLIAAGGSGGHLFPAQQLAEILKGDAEVFFAGHKLQESPFFTKEKIPFTEIRAAPPKRGGWFSFFVQTWIGFWQSFALIRKKNPDLVVGFGSYHSFPTLLAAACLRKKIFLFEANCFPGKVNRLFAPLAHRIAIQFPLQNPHWKQVLVPRLPWVKRRSSQTTREEARSFFHLAPDLLTFLVFGGSQGARMLNEQIPPALFLLEGVKCQVIHLTGKGQRAPSYGAIPSFVREFESRIDLAYLAADFVISRSGAGTVAELIEFEKPALLIPFPYATDDHQWVNGKFLAQEVKGARLLREKEASPERIWAELKSLLERRDEMIRSLQEWKKKVGPPTEWRELLLSQGGIEL